MKKDDRQRLFEVMQKVDPTFKPKLNEELEEGWKDIAAGAMMGAASLMPMKAGAQTQNIDTPINKPNIEMTQDNQKQAYAFMVGIATESASLSMQKGDIDSAGAFKEIAIYYENLRDGKTPEPLSSAAKLNVKHLINIYKTLDNNTISNFIQSGMNIHR